jgi:GNAT superfamily N-acetyltransferase
LPTTFADPPNAGDPGSRSQDAADRESRATVEAVREIVVPALLRAASDRGWWDPLTGTIDAGASVAETGSFEPTSAIAGGSSPTIVAGLDAAAWSRLTLVPRVIAPARVAAAHALVGAALRDGARVTAAIANGGSVVGVALSAAGNDRVDDLLALGVAPDQRRQGLAGRLLAEHLASVDPGRPIRARIGVAERDVIEPLDYPTGVAIARRLLESAGFVVERAPDPVGRIDPLAIVAIRH